MQDAKGSRLKRCCYSEARNGMTGFRPLLPISAR